GRYDIDIRLNVPSTLAKYTHLQRKTWFCERLTWNPTEFFVYYVFKQLNVLHQVDAVPEIPSIWVQVEHKVDGNSGTAPQEERNQPWAVEEFSATIGVVYYIPSTFLSGAVLDGPSYSADNRCARCLCPANQVDENAALLSILPVRASVRSYHVVRITFTVLLIRQRISRYVHDLKLTPPHTDNLTAIMQQIDVTGQSNRCVRKTFVRYASTQFAHLMFRYDADKLVNKAILEYGKVKRTLLNTTININALSIPMRFFYDDMRVRRTD
ncbi:hypothetical protein CLF_110181, partial [Clonorchis sinensis]